MKLQKPNTGFWEWLLLGCGFQLSKQGYAAGQEQNLIINTIFTNWNKSAVGFNVYCLIVCEVGKMAPKNF